jgi:hypothetical protein
LAGQEFDEQMWKKWLGAERYLAFSKYPDAPTVEHAVVLNHRIAAAILEDCSHIEVALRNRVHERLQARLAERDIYLPWIDDPTSELARLGRDVNSRISEARRRAEAQKHAATVSDVVCELTLGFWLALYSKRAQSIRPDLIGVFEAYETRSLTPLLEGLNGLRVLRNRVAHHHRVLHRDLHRDAANISRVAGWLDPELQNFVTRSSRLGGLLPR